MTIKQYEIKGELYHTGGDYTHSLGELATMLNSSDKEVMETAIKSFHFTSFESAYFPDNWVLVGAATMTAEIDDTGWIEKEAFQLREEIKQVQATANNKITKLTAKLNNILALENHS